MTALEIVGIILIICFAALAIVAIYAYEYEMGEELRRRHEQDKTEKPSIEETMLRNASDQSLRMNMLAMEAFRQMTEAARHNNDDPFSHH